MSDFYKELDEELSEAQQVLRDGEHDQLAESVAVVRNELGRIRDGRRPSEGPDPDADSPAGSPGFQPDPRQPVPPHFAELQARVALVLANIRVSTLLVVLGCLLTVVGDWRNWYGVLLVGTGMVGYGLGRLSGPGK